MKKLFLGLLILFTLSSNVMAQSGADDLKSASKLLAKYNKEPFANAESLTEAIALIESAFKDESVATDPQSWITRAEIFNGLADAQTKSKLLNPAYEVGEPMAAVYAAKAYLQAAELAKSADSKTAKKVIKSVKSGLSGVEEFLNNFGVGQYQENDYAGALENFMTEIEVYDYLKAEGEESRLDGEGMYADKLYFTGVTATYGEDYDRALPILEKVVAMGTEEAVVYQFLYQGYEAQGDEEKSGAILKKGREMFPDDSNLLFTEINYYLKKGELEKMIANLEAALAQEPGNVSVITTLGQVYDQLSVKSNESGDKEKSLKYYEKAVKFYSDALNDKPDNFDLNYSMGALYYNRAATFTDDLNALADDFTPAGVKKYEAIKDKMAGLFDQALPYFLKADSLNGEDRNTLIALKEITARKDDFEGSEKYKARLEALSN